MEHFHTGGLDLLWGKGWQSQTLAEILSEMVIPAIVVCVFCQIQTFSPSKLNKPWKVLILPTKYPTGLKAVLIIKSKYLNF